MTTGLIVVDVQQDFCEGGSLAVKGGNEAAYMIASHLAMGKEDFVVYTKDWHYKMPNDNGGHFAVEPDYKDTWPVHCVLGTPGAQFNKDIAQMVCGTDHHVFYKGTGRPDYSGFQGFNVSVTLDAHLQSRQADKLVIVGIAGDVCVRSTALDAIALGYQVRLLPECIASVGGPMATAKVMEELRK